MKKILVKVYGYLESSDKSLLENCFNCLQEVCAQWYLEPNIFVLDDAVLHISHEGEYFPLEDVVKELQKCISMQSKGKLDYIDLEEWTLTRYFLDFKHNKNQKTGELYFRKSSLNHAIAEAQEKCSKYRG